MIIQEVSVKNIFDDNRILIKSPNHFYSYSFWGPLFIQYPVKGLLPWTYIQEKNDRRREEKILTLKQQTAPMKLCNGCPIEFSMFLNYCKGLRFEEDPDYDYLRKLFRNLAKKK